jgi:serine-type D-Ala-D-Ala carboxypeptidase/endopeptidase (penicillin-binding protein 4)
VSLSKHRFWFYTFAATLLLSHTVVARDKTPLPPAVASAIAGYHMPSNNVSVFVQDTRTDAVILAYNEDLPRQPASTIKVLTTIAALETLGPAYTWMTRAYVTGNLRNGVLEGDLIIVGGGDPYLTAERWWSFVSQLRQTGLTAINGDVIIDRTYFAHMDDDRSNFDGHPYRSYNVVPDALMVSFQTSTFTIGPDIGSATNKLAGINIDPLPANLQVINKVRLGSGNCRRAQQGLRFNTPDGPNGNLIEISGMMPRGCGRYTASRAIMSAPEYAYGTFATLWQQSGGSIKGKLRVEPLPNKARLLLEFPSLTVGEITRLVNKFSNNVMARTLMLTMGADRFGAPATVENGRRAVRQWLTDKNIEIPGLALDNGSGLSRNERLTARGMAAVLHAAAHSQYAPEFIASLPLGGTDGTLRARFNAPSMQGRIRMKTGTLDDVGSIAGYVNAVSGNQYIVVIFIDHNGVYFGVDHDVQAAVLRWVFAQ